MSRKRTNIDDYIMPGLAGILISGGLSLVQVDHIAFFALGAGMNILGIILAIFVFGHQDIDCDKTFEEVVLEVEPEK